LLAIHNRIGRIIWVFYCQWPNAFFLPEDDIYTMLDSGHFESLDQVEFIMTLEEMFDVKIDDDQAQKIFPQGQDPSTYRRLLTGLLDVYDPDQGPVGAEWHWEPLSLPPDYFEQSLWHDFKRYLPLTWSDGSLHRDLRRLQVIRPASWTDKWAGFDDRLIQARDRVSRLLVDELDWFHEAFIPQDRLEALFHSYRGLGFVASLLTVINSEFKSDIEPDFITSGKHTYEDLLKKLVGTG